MMSPFEYVVKLETYCNAMQAVIDAGGRVQLTLATDRVYQVKSISVFDDNFLVELVGANSSVRLDSGWGFMVSFAPW